MNPPSRRLTFDATAARVIRRLALAEWCRLLGRSAPPLFGTLILAWLLLRHWGMRDSAWWAIAVLALWLGGTAGLAWWRRHAPFAALAVWDRSTQAREMFASAWSFEREADRSAGAELHLTRAHEHLPNRLGQLSRDLPLRLRPHAWIAPVLFLVVALSHWLVAPLPLEDQTLSAEARVRAGTVGKELAERARIIDPLKSLSEEEKERLKHLRSELEQAAKKLDRLGTPRNLLEDLERRARDTEKLASTLRVGEQGTLSSGFLSELERTADTADFGSALRAGNMGAAAEEARLLEARLGQRKPTLEEQKRLEEALKRALAAATQKERNSPLGQHLAEAQKQLGAGNPGAAGQQFGNLAQQFGQSAQRQQAQQQLRNLAQSFRGAGQQILGGQNLQRLTPGGTGANGVPPLAGMLPSPGSGNPILGLPHPGAGNGATQMPLPIPGTGTPKGTLLFPIPGTAPSNAPTLVIPGTGGGQNPNGAFPIPGGGFDPNGGIPAGSVAGSAAAGAGGTEAGNGTAALGADPTKLIDSANTGVVAPTVGGEGPSQVRALEGDSHRESAARSARQIAVDFLKTEEAALAEESIPISRREQVLRYFTAVRQQLENQHD